MVIDVIDVIGKFITIYQGIIMIVKMQVTMPLLAYVSFA